jgi:hypothetical protein
MRILLSPGGLSAPVVRPLTLHPFAYACKYFLSEGKRTAIVVLLWKFSRTIQILVIRFHAQMPLHKLHAIAFVALTCAPLLGQDFRARVQGSVTDPTRAVVSGALATQLNVLRSRVPSDGVSGSGVLSLTLHLPCSTALIHEQRPGRRSDETYAGCRRS